jgi:hypothetical protein
MTDDSRQTLRILARLLFIVLAFLIIHFIASIIALVIGAVFRWQCQIQENIPVYLIVFGAVFITYYLLQIPLVSNDYIRLISTYFSLVLHSFQCKGGNARFKVDSWKNYFCHHDDFYFFHICLEYHGKLFTLAAHVSTIMLVRCYRVLYGYMEWKQLSNHLTRLCLPIAILLRTILHLPIVFSVLY